MSKRMKLGNDVKFVMVLILIIIVQFFIILNLMISNSFLSQVFLVGNIK